MKRFIPVALAVALWVLTSARAQELPRCPHEGCGQAVTSSWWKFCPACGSPLPEFKLQGPLAAEERILGNVYTNGALGFRIECPNDGWQILKGRSARELHEKAAMVMTGEPAIFALVMGKEMPDTTLEQFADQVKPALKPLAIVEEEKRTVDGRPALVRTFRGKRQESEFAFRILVAADGARRFQVVCWTLQETYDGAGKAEIAKIVDSFHFLK